MEGALEILGKGTGADPENELTNREKTLLIESLRPRWRLCELLSALGMARSSYQYQQGALRAPDRDEEARRRISEVFDANDGIYGRRRIHDEPRDEGRDHRGAQDRPHHGRGGARGPGQDEAKAAPRLLRGRDDGTSGKQGQAGLRGGASQLPVARGRDAVLIPPAEPCLSPVLDCSGGSIVSWTTSASPNAEMDSSMLEAAIGPARPSERTAPHRPQRLRMPLPVARVDIGLRGGGNHPPDVQEGPSPDSSRMEGFFGTMKNEMFCGRDWEGVSLEELGKRTDDYIEWYNTEEDQALAGLDEPLGIQARPSPCSLARTVRKSGTTPNP